MAQPLPSRRQAKEPIAAEGLHAPAPAPALFCETVGGAGAVADELATGTGTGTRVEAVGADIMMEEVVWIGDWVGFAADGAAGRVVVDVDVDVAAAFEVEWVLGAEIASDVEDGLGLTLVMSVDSVDLMTGFVLAPGGETVGLDAAALVFDAVLLGEGCVVVVVVVLVLVLKYRLLKGTITKVDALDIVLGGAPALELDGVTEFELDGATAIVLDRTTALELVMVEEVVLATLEVLMFATMLDTLATVALDLPTLPTLTGTLLFG